jgi:hypothetical protein
MKKFMDESCFSGFEEENNPNNFYSVYRNLFETLKMQEEKAYASSGV